MLPNKRGALFLKKHLAQTFAKTIWLPTIISIEDLIHEVSGLQIIEEVDLICLLYESYKTCIGKEAESFESFAKWGNLILQDFNEIDRFLADPVKLYENLKDIKEIENWSLGEEKLSEYQMNYLKFMNSLGPIYKHYTSFLLSKQWAYQGLAYRTAVNNIETCNYFAKFSKILFCGFNALNTSEIKIIQYLEKSGFASLLWDADEYYLKNNNQEAGQFLRQNFNLFPNKEPFLIENNYAQPKDITILSVPKQIGQAQVVKQKIEEIIEQGVPLDKVAIVLANEKMLWPVLQQLPKKLTTVNITMEYPISYTSCYGLIEQLIQLQLNYASQNKNQKTIYHKELLALLRHPIFKSFGFANEIRPSWNVMINQINQRNLVFISPKNLKEIFGEDLLCFEPMIKVYHSTAEFCVMIQSAIEKLSAYFLLQNQNNQLALEQAYLNVLSANFNRLIEIISKYPYYNSWPSFKQLFIQVIGGLSAPFVGEPLQGLQIMGVLETRTLDFDYLILLNVNEGVLPAGKTNGSFIPNDLKRVFGLPLYSEKDAIYAYHFYRLIQRANNILITYDSETDSMGKGEKSRFVTQLQLELKKFNEQINIVEQTVVDKPFINQTETAIRIPKTELALEPVLSKALSNTKYGALSPSSLIVFKECSLKFYFRYAAHLKENLAVEEVAEANTFGSILHRTLELIFLKSINSVLNNNNLNEMLSQVDYLSRQAYMEFFDGKAPSGKNILQEEVIKVYCKKVIQSDIKLVADLKKINQDIKILDLEKEFSAPLQIINKGQPINVYIKGKVDRIDLLGNEYRVIDYKNSIQSSDVFVFKGFEQIFSDTKYNKQFQLLMYAWLLHKNNFCAPESMRPSIIPLKVFSNQPQMLLDTYKKPLILTNTFFIEFEEALIHYVQSIFDETNDFFQTDDRDVCEYCSYNAICNFQVQ